MLPKRHIAFVKIFALKTNEWLIIIRDIYQIKLKYKVCQQ